MATTATLNAGAARASAGARSETIRMAGPVSGIMRDDFLSVTKGQNAEAALDTVKRSRLAAGLSSLVFVVGENGAYEGFVRLSSLVRAHGSDLVDGLIEGKDFAVGRALDQEQAARQLQMKDIALLPVVDDSNVLVGVLTFDDAMDVLEVETSDDIYYKAGVGDMFKTTDHVRSEKLTQGPIWYAVRVRILFLMVTLVGGLLVGGLIDTFEDVLGAVIALAIFIPLVMDMGGNVGTQSSTIFARGFALGHITMQDFARKHLLREASVGLTMALGIAVLAGTVAYFWQGVPNDIPQLGIVVGVALFTSIFLASVLGFLLPWAMVKIGVDHAPGADPFITTIKDFTGLLVYFLMASWLIGIEI
ncbi:MAG: magnesium transporter [Salinarimonas sp.]